MAKRKQPENKKLKARDKVTLEKYGRFLEPLLQTMMAKESDRSRAARDSQYLSAVQTALITQARQ